MYGYSGYRDTNLMKHRLTGSEGSPIRLQKIFTAQKYRVVMQPTKRGRTNSRGRTPHAIDG